MSGPADPAVSVCFVVTLDDFDLGAFTSCEGLGAEVVIEQREEGGNNGFVWQLPTRVTYPNITLSRALTTHTAQVARWVSQAVGGAGRDKPRTAQIKAMTAELQVVAQWGLLDVVPVRWTGPSFTADSPKVAMETIEIAHHGFVG